MAESIILYSGNSPGGIQAKHGKSEILYAVPVEPCRGNGWHVQGDGIGVCKGLLDTRRQNPYTNMETAHIIMETRREFS